MAISCDNAKLLSLADIDSFAPAIRCCSGGILGSALLPSGIVICEMTTRYEPGSAPGLFELALKEYLPSAPVMPVAAVTCEVLAPPDGTNITCAPTTGFPSIVIVPLTETSPAIGGGPDESSPEHAVTAANNSSKAKAFSLQELPTSMTIESPQKNA